MTTLRRAALGAFLGMVVLGCGPAFSQSVPYSESDLANARVRRIIGMAVENRDGAKLGTIRDFVVDFHTGRINYAILSTAGILGLRAQLTAVPPQALSTATVKARTLALDVSKVHWDEAPRFKKQELQGLAERTQEVLIYQFYGLPVIGPKPARGAAPRPKDQLQLATVVMGSKVTGRNGEALGKVSGLLVDLKDKRPAMAVITTTVPSMKKQTYAVPLRALSLVAPGNIKVDATAVMFEEAQLLTPKGWQLASTKENVVYRYE